MYDAIVLAGGGARRLGGVAKPQLVVDGRTMLNRVLDAVSGAQQVIVAGPAQPTVRPVRSCREDPPGGGPVAAVAAAAPLTVAPRIVVLAADLPWISPAVPELLAHLPPRGMALLVDEDGRANYLAAAWQRAALLDALAALPAIEDAAMRALCAQLEQAQQVRVPDRGGWGRDYDTWDDLANVSDAARVRRTER